MKLSPNTRYLIGVLFCISMIVLAMLWLESKYQRMKHDCQTMGGKFYSISFTENICVEGETVRQLD